MLRLRKSPGAQVGVDLRCARDALQVLGLGVHHGWLHRARVLGDDGELGAVVDAQAYLGVDDWVAQAFVPLHVAVEMPELAEFFVADCAGKRLHACVHGLVRADVGFLGEPFAAGCALERAGPRVHDTVPVEVAALVEDFAACVALVGCQTHSQARAHQTPTCQSMAWHGTGARFRPAKRGQARPGAARRD